MANVNSWLPENRLLAGVQEVDYLGVGDYGVAISTLTDAMCNVRARELNLGSLTVEYDNESSKFATGDHTRDEAIAGITQGTIDFNMKLAQGQVYVTSGTYSTSADGTYSIIDPTNTPNTTNGNLGLPYKKYLEGSGLVSIYNPATVEVASGAVTVATPASWEFYPSTEGDLNTLTMAIQDKASVKVGSPKTQYGIQYKLAGAMSTFKIDASSGKPFMLGYSFAGKVSEVVEVSDVAGTLLTYDDKYALSTIANKMLFTYVTIEELEQNGDATGNTMNWCVGTFAFDAGTSIVPFPCQEGGSGIKYNAITSRDPRITINPFLERVGPTGSTEIVTADWFDFWEATNSESSFKLTIRTYDKDKTAPDAQEQFAIIVPRGQLISPNISDDNGFLRNEMTFRPMRNIKATGVGSDVKEADYVIKIYAQTEVI